MCTRIPPLRRDFTCDEGFQPPARVDPPTQLGLDRLARVYRPDEAFYEFRDGHVYRVSVNGHLEWASNRLTRATFILLGRWGPRGIGWNDGIVVAIDGKRVEIEARAACTPEGLADAHRSVGAECYLPNMKWLAEAIDWAT